MNNRRLRTIRGDSGQSTVEFAFASLIFFVTIFGILEFGLAVWQYNMVSSLAQEGARHASVLGSTSTIPHPESVQDFVQRRSPGITVTTTVTSECVDGSPATEVSARKPGQTVCVRVETAFAPLTALIPIGTMHLRSRAGMVMAR